MSNIITSKVPGIEFDPESIADDGDSLNKEIAELEALIAANKAEREKAERALILDSEPNPPSTVLRFAYPDNSNVYYFKCQLVSMTTNAGGSEITIENSQNQILKLFSYWQKSIVANTNRNRNDIKITYALRNLHKKKRMSSGDENIAKARLTAIYTNINGIKRSLLEIDSPKKIVEMQYLVRKNSSRLKICL